MRILILLLFAAGLGACQSDKKAAVEPSEVIVKDSSALVAPVSKDTIFNSELEKTYWTVKYIDYEGTKFMPDTVRAVEIRFNRGLLNALANCNRLTANFRTPESGTIALEDVRVSQNTACDPKRIQFERRMFSVLQEMSTYRFAKGSLMLTSSKGTIMCTQN